MTVNVLHLSHRTQREANMLKQAEQQGFSIKWFEGVWNKKNPREEITKGHQRIVQYAKDEELPYCLIAEDDCQFFDLGAFDYFISQLPEEYSMFMGLIYVGDIDKNNRVVSEFSGGMTFYSIHQSAYDWFLALPTNIYIDRYIGGKWKEVKLYVCNPMVVEQMGGYSDNLRRTIKTYRVYLENKSIYKNA